MTRARGRGRHRPAAGKTDEYLYRATGQDALDEHQEQLQASDDSQAPPGPSARPEPPPGPPGWERLAPPVRGVPRGRSESDIRQYGAGDDRGIPGGSNHVDLNKPAERFQVPAPLALEEFRGMMAHGVPPVDIGHYNRELEDRLARPYHPAAAKLPAALTPVPVYITEGGAGDKSLTSAAFHRIQVNYAGLEPTRLCSRDPNRKRVRLLNEDTANLVRLANTPALLTAATGFLLGAVLPAVTNSFLNLDTQDEIWAIADTASSYVFVSVILETYLREAS